MRGIRNIATPYAVDTDRASGIGATKKKSLFKTLIVCIIHHAPAKGGGDSRALQPDVVEY